MLTRNSQFPRSAENGILCLVIVVLFSISTGIEASTLWNDREGKGIQQILGEILLGCQRMSVFAEKYFDAKKVGRSLAACRDKIPFLSRRCIQEQLGLRKNTWEEQNHRGA